MFKVGSSFLAIDFVLELIALISVLLIGFYSYKIYKITSQKRYKYFFVAFLLLAISFLTRTLANALTYIQIIGGRTAEILHLLGPMNQYGFVLNSFLILTAYMALTCLVLKISDKRVISLLMFFVLLSTFIIYKIHLMYYFIAGILLVYVVVCFYLNYRENRKKASFLVFLSFFCLFLANISFLFMSNNLLYYYMGHTLRLSSYLLLLCALILIIKK